MHITTRIALLAGAVLAAGCTNLPRTLEPEPIFPPPGQPIPVPDMPKGPDGSVCFDNATLPNGNIPAEITQFSVAMYCAYQLPPGGAEQKKWLLRFVQKGVSLSDLTCERFFNALEERRVEAAYAQTNMNIGAAAVTAVLAATDAHRRSIFNLAAALTAGNAWFENYKVNYVMTPQTRKVHDLIQGDLREPIRKQILAKNQSGGYNSFDDAKRDIVRYDALCSHKVIQDIVSEAIARAELKPFAPPPDPVRIAQAEAELREIHKIASAGGAGAMTGGQFEALYVVATTEPGAARAEAAKALVDLHPALGTWVKNLGLDNADATPPTLTRFKYAGELLGLGAKESVALLREQIEKRVAERAKPVKDDNAAGGQQSRLQVPAVTDQTRRQVSDLLSAPAARISGDVDFRWEIRDHRRQR